MKNTYFTAVLAVVSGLLLGTAILLSSPSTVSAEAKKPVQGQDVGDKNCERIDGPESSTFGKCKSVCADKDVTWDAVGRRYVCKAKASVRTPSRIAVPAATVGVKTRGN